MIVNGVKVTQLGKPGHFIAARGCCFFIHTNVGDRYTVSSVGCYHPQSVRVYERSDANRETVGHERLYETMVFPIVNGETDTSAMLEGIGSNDETSSVEVHDRLVRLAIGWVAEGREVQP